MSSCRHGNPLTWGSWSSHDLLRFDLTSVCADRVPAGMNAVEFDTTPEEKLEVTAAA